MKNKIPFLISIAFVLSLVVLLTGCDFLQGLIRNPDYLYEDGAVLVDGSDNPIKLVNNEKAMDVSYAELLAFISEDSADLIQYVDRCDASGKTPFVCADFAEAVHNNAEQAGIRAAYVSIDWENETIGHAINGFQTTDRGPVFIDCTGRSSFSQVEEGNKATSIDSWDKVAYIEIGKKYGVIGLDYARSPDYAYFEQYDQSWQDLKERLAAYNSEVRQYNQEIAGKVFREGSAELARIRDWEARLVAEEDEIVRLSTELGDSRFRPLGVVKNYNMHW